MITVATPAQVQAALTTMQGAGQIDASVDIPSLERSITPIINTASELAAYKRMDVSIANQVANQQQPYTKYPFPAP